MKRINIIIFLFFFAFPAIAVIPDSLYIKANKFYAEGRYAEAADLYDSLINSGYTAPEVYFNLGNACFKMRQIGKAILNYERAHRLKPFDEDIGFNLHLARTFTIDKIESLPEFFLTAWWRAFRSLMDSDHWMILSIVFFIASLLLILSFLFSARVNLKRTFFFLSFLFLLGAIITGISGYRQSKEFHTRNEGIVMVPSATVKSSPDAGSSDLFVLHEGTKVRIEDAVGNWVEIRIANGNKGWIEFSNLEII